MNKGTSKILLIAMIPVFAPMILREIWDTMLDFDDPVGVDQYLSFSLLEQSYDFIVLGGGTAGSVLASRLSEDSSKTVLLVEAGSDGSFITNVPGAAMLPYVTESPINWEYQAQSDGKTCVGHVSRSCVFHRGKVLGGTSVLNTMILNRGNKADYDFWSDLGNEGWSYEDLLPYFKKSENQLDFNVGEGDLYHGNDGPLPVGRSGFQTALAEAFEMGAKELGQDVGPVDEDNQLRFSVPQTATKNGMRYSAAKAYLSHAKDRPNLTIILNTIVSRVLIENKIAVGVELKRGSETISIRSRNEIVLSAGAFGSPQILMLSGIGPKKHLQDLGIPLVKELPVGEGMQSHIGTPEITFTLDKPAGAHLLHNMLNPITFSDYLLKGSGPLSSTAGLEGFGFMRSGLDPNNTWPDLEIFFMAAHISTGGRMGGRIFGMNDKIYKEKYEAISFKEGFSILPYLLHPKSTGRVLLASRDPEDPPIIEPNFFKDPSDFETLLKGIRFSIRLGETKGFKKYGAKHFNVSNPYCTHLTFNSDEYWKCCVRYLTYNVNHESGTCRMGPKSDPKAVVDPELKVHGIQGLRVVDLSIMPETVSGHTYWPIVAIAEKAADIIKKNI